MAVYLFSWAAWVTVLALINHADASGAPPVFTNPPGSTTNINVAENTAVTTSVFQAAATDAESDALTYSLVTPPTEFTITAAGEISVNGNINFEAVASYILTVRVNDGTSDVDVTLTFDVTDVDEKPEFTNVATDGSTTAPIAENSAVGISIFTAMATDPEGASVTFSLVSPPAVFTISTGGVMTVNGALNFENVPSYTITVRVTDGTNTNDQTMTVSITNVDEAPTFTSPAADGSTRTNVVENSVTGTSVYTVVASDPEGATLTFSLVTPPAQFTITTLGEIQVATATIDFETLAYYALTVRITDGTNPVDVVLNVDITDVNESPSFTNIASDGSTNVNIAEDSGTGTSVLSVVASDPEGDTLTITLVSAPTEFTLNAANQIQVNGALDFETTPSYTLTVRVTDGTNADVDHTMTVTITNVDEAPTFTSPAADGSTRTNVAENSVTGTSVYAVVASDPEGATLTFSLVTPPAQFTITTLGEIQVATATIDFETLAYYALTVRITDGTNPVDVALNVDITDVNESPSFTNIASDGSTNVNIAEDAGTGTSVLSVVALDPEGDTLTITLVSAPTEFTINAANQIQVNGALDFETTPSYTLTVRVTDGTNADVDHTMTVTITNVDEAPTFTSPAADGSTRTNVAENSVTGTSVYAVVASDPEGATLTFSLVTPPAQFTITTLGEIQVATATIDFETLAYYALTVRITDGTNPVDVVLNVDITDVNESPSFTNIATDGSTNVNIAEDSGTGTSVLSVVASDPEGDTLTITLVSAPTEFTINAANQIQVNGALDFETTPSYTLTFRVTDGTNADVDHTMTVTITNVDEAPTFTSPAADGSTRTNVAENSVTGTSVYAVVASDPEGATLTFSLVTPPAQFTITTLGEIQVATATIDFETLAYYALTVRITDGTNPVDVVLNVDITDVNESPSFTNIASDGSTNVNIAEDAGTGTSVLSVVALDPEGDTLTITLVSAPTEFTLNAANQIQVNGALDFETTPSHTLTVRVTDGTNADVDHTMTVTITNVDEAPTFTSPAADGSTRTNVAENSVTGTSVYAVVASDPEGATLTFSLVTPPAQFTITTLGEIQVATATIDFETLAYYALTVRITDGTNPVDVVLNVDITDVNESPSFTNIASDGSTNVNIAEDAGTGTSVLSVVALDPEGDTLTITLVSAPTEFTINAANQIQVNGALDFETTPSHTLTVRVTDGTNADVDHTMTVTITNVDEAPTFTSPAADGSTRTNVAENSVTGTSVYAVVASDPEGATLTFSLVTPPAQFTITTLGEIQVATATIDFETLAYYALTVRITDGTNPVDVVLNVDITDVNESPSFTNIATDGSTNVNIAEDSGTGTSVLSVVALDPEGDTLTITLVSAPTEFTINAANQIQVNGALDFETTPSYTLTVRVTDGTNADVDHTMTVTITNVDEAPTFTSPAADGSTRTNVAENSVTGTSVYAVVASDPEGATLTFSLVTPPAQFTITTLGEIQVATATIDFETLAYYALTVRITDGTNPVDVVLNVDITDVNESPSFTNIATDGSTNVNIAEDSGTGTSVLSVVALDPEGDTLTITLVSAPTEFTINAANQIQVNGALDFETTPSYTLTVRVTDGTNADVDHTMTVTITNVDEAPTFTSPAADGSTRTNVAENSVTGTSVYAVVASDPEGATLTFSLVTPPAQFTITTLGEIQVATATIDFETLAYYALTVRITDGTNPVDVVLNIDITDVNESPSFTNIASDGSTNVNIAEDSGTGTSVLSVVASDPEGDTLTITLVSAPTEFTINAANQIQVNGALDFETTPSYTLTVRVTDGTNADVDHTMSVTITNVDEAPTFTSPAADGSTRTNVAENSVTGTSVFAVVASDPEGATLTFSLVTPPAQFTITTLGEIQVATATIDFETLAYYALTVRITDGTNPVDVVLNVDITDVNESPSFTNIASDGSTNVNIAEDSGTGTSVLSVVASDPEGDTLTITLVSAPTEFTINAANQIQVNGALDFETTPSYTLTVRVTDGTNADVDHTMTVTITNVDEAPTFTSPAADGSTRTNVAENSVTGTSVYAVVASDPEGATLTFSLVTPPAQFTITTLGEIQVATATIDFETLAYYALTVRITDGTNPVDVVLNVDITDVNESPSFTNIASDGSTNVNIAEDSGTGTSVLSVVALDPEGDTLTITLVSAPTEFTINAANQIQVNGALDFETTPSYTLTVRVTDGTNADVDHTMTVTITNVDEAPTFTSPAADGSTRTNVAENSVTGTSVYAVVASDPEGATLTFSLVTPPAQFTITTLGEIQVATATIDFETLAYYALTVRITDGTNPVDVVLNVDITDVNESPSFTNIATDGSTNVNIAEDSGTGTSVLSVVASDPEGDTLTITLVSAPTEFTLNAANQIQVNGALDFETTPSYTLTVRVTDGTNADVDHTMTVTITNVDEAPTFTSPAADGSTRTNVAENSVTGTSVYAVVASDPEGATLTFSLVTPPAQFTITTLGEIQVATATIDFETLAYYALTVRITDGTNPVDVVLNVDITDVNESPSFTNIASDGSTNVNIAEDSGTGTSVLSVVASDPEGDTLTITLVSAPTEFTINAANQIQVNGALDFETTPSYTLTVRVTDGTNTPVDHTMTVTITDVNEAPTFTNLATDGSTRASVAENSVTGTSIFAVIANDQEGDPLTISLVAPPAQFTIVSGEVQAGATTTDYETQTVFVLSVRVTDGTSTVDATLNVDILDINEPPVVSNLATDGSSSVNVAEDAGVGASVFDVTATDPEGATLTFSLLSGPAEFTITSTGQVQVNAALDFETTPSYTLNVRVSDGTSDVDRVLTVGITDVNEAPTFTNVATTPYPVSENVNIGTSVVTIAATDSDAGNDGTITYTLLSTTTAGGTSVAGVFHLDSVSGKISTMASLDRESVASYDVTVRASDGGTPAKTVDRTFTISAEDYNDNAPVFTSAPYSNSPLETATTTAGTTIVAVAATDADATSTLAYAIEVGDSTRFQFGASGLELKTAINLDSPDNDPDYYVLRIIVTDGGTPELTGTTSVTVSIVAVNDHDPAFAAGFPSTVPFAEDTAVGTVIETVAATDPDAGSDGQITYSITNGNTNTDFSIDPTYGIIKLQNTLNFETTPSYTLEVTASDGGGTVRSATTIVTVSVTNINDNLPSCPSYAVYVTVLESSSVNDVVTTLSCTDADTTDVLSYTVLSGNADGSFALDGSTGSLSLAGTVDYDSATTSYTLQIQVSDGTNSRTVTVYVDVGAVNEATPTFATPFPVVSVSESDLAGTTVHTYTAADSDYAPHAVTTYAISTVTQGGLSLFSIDQSSAVITLASSVDYDSLPAGTKFYLLTLTATDGGGLQGTGTVTVSVTDANDNIPSCSQSSWSQNVAENVATFPTTLIASLGCSDVEDGTSLVYNLVQSPGSHFGVTSGIVTIETFMYPVIYQQTILNTSDAVDYEANTGHTLTITVSDTGSPIQSTTVTVNLNVINVNDGPPTFSGTFSSTIAEDSTIGISVADVVATDPDGNNAFGSPVYSIQSGDLNNQFTIDSSTGRVSTIANLDRETKASYDLVIKAKESGDIGTATVTLTVTITDVNDNTPSCSQNSFVVTVSEAESAGFGVNTFTCTDDDTTGTVSYTLSTGDTTKFEMSSNILQLKIPLDYDFGVTTYDVIVTISDTANSVSIPGTIHVGNVNEAPPVFSPVIYPVSHSENLALASTIAQVTATDADSAATADGQITFAFVASYPLFALDSTSGIITLVSSLDRETDATHDLLVTATDGTTTVTATVSLTITDENDNTPVFGSGSYSGSVSETDAVGASVVVTIAATDIDDPATGGNGQITYSIIGGNTNSDFTIDASNGEIKTAKLLDYETAVSHSLTVKAVDRAGDAQSRSATTIVSITVTNVNEHSPIFTPTTIIKAVPEITAIGTLIHQILANDADSGTDGDLTYTMTAHATFALASDGALTLKDNLNYVTASTHSLTVTATDSGTPSRSTDVSVTINVVDDNNNTPSCSPSSTTVIQREDHTGNVASLSCTDLDTGASGTLSYIIESVNAVAGSGSFSVDTSGAVSTTGLDYETVTSHSIIIRVEDSAVPALSTSTTVIVSVTDVNEAAPVFLGTPFNPSMAESEAVGFTILTVAATDADTANTVTYSLTDTTNLLIGSATGVITLKVQQDRETNPTVTVDVCATDSGTVDAIKSTCETLTLTITDVNDNLPVFNPSSYTTNVDENTATGTTVMTVTATDADDLGFGTITYSIESGNTDTVFSIAAGVITVTDNTGLDFETTQLFTLTVRATDGGGLTSDVIVSIGVNPINENSPTFTPASSTEIVPEDSVLGHVVIDLDATDPDSGLDGQVTFSIISGSLGKFVVDSSTGIVRVSDVLDAESVLSYTVTVQATDAGTNPSTLSGTYILTVSVTDVNDVAPSCTQAYYSTAITESTGPTTSVQQIVCSDSDINAPNNALSYAKIAGDPGNLFDLDTSTGLVSVAAGASFDRETTASYLLNVTVTDGGATPLSTVIHIFVSITDENDNTPAFGQNPYTPSIVEDATPGSAVVTVAATDTDAGPNGDVVYFISSGNSLGHFTVDSVTGVVSVQASLDRESLSSYVLEVKAQDKGTPASLTGTSTVSITITDVNDNFPLCTSSVYTGNVPEDAAVATSVGTVSCPDADDPPNNNVVYTITAGNTGSVFAVGSTSGEVTVNAGLDAETLSVYNLILQASDGTLTTFAIVTVTVSDVNEHDPVFAPPGPYSESFSEDTPLGTTIKDINANDNDVSNSVLSFSITLGNTDNKFWIDPTSGTVVLQAALDRETTDTYSLTIEVADGTGAGSRTATTQLTVLVLDVNDNDPVCAPSNYINTLPEDSSIGTTVSSLTCSDADSSTPTLAYSITTGNGDGKFTIDAASGVVTIFALLDYETKTTYSLEIQVSDQGGTARVITVPVSLDVTPINEAAPVFSPVTPVAIQEDVSIGTLVYTVTATDTDMGLLHGTIRYSVTTGNGLGHFTIDEGTGEIKTVGNVDRESMASYTLKIRATDDYAGSGNERNSEVDLSITVDDVNDNIPVFVPVIYIKDVLETAPSGSTVAVVTSRDDDDVPNATPVYTILSGNTGNVLTFVGNELILDTGKTFNYEILTKYDLVIQVSDSGTPLLSSNGRIIINVLSENEFAPIPAVPNDSITVSELIPVGTNFYNASAVDGDAGTDGEFLWSITNGNSPELFFCSPQLGELYISSVLDYDTPPNTHNITVEAQDKGGLTGSFWLEIILQDENDEYPVFSQSIYTPFLYENVPIGSGVKTVTATDKDSGINGQVTYSILSGSGQTYFAIHSTTGVITTAKDIDREEHIELFLILQAIDGGTPPLSTVGVVKVIIVDLNDNAPTFTHDYFVQSLSEDTTVGTSVTTVYAKDADSSANNNNVFTYSLTDAYFDVNPGSGQISVKAPLDRETISSHNLTIYATDLGSPANTGTTLVTVNLLDINDNKPDITGSYFTNLSEDISPGTIVFTIAASDIDSGMNAELVYSIVSGNTDGDFKIEIGSGIVQVVNSLDRERTASYNHVIHVTDKGTPPLTASVTTTIVIDDVNDNNPIFNISPYTFNIAENVPSGSSVGTVQATDLDTLTNAALTYEIVVFWIGEASHFNLDLSSGVITTAGNLDRETIDTYNLRCRAKDGGTPQLTGDVNVTIVIDDLNDNPPVFNPTQYTGSVNENTVAGTSILTVTVTDADAHNGAITLSIDTSTPEGVRGDQFLIVDPTSGIVSVKSVMDREVDVEFNVTILAVDNGTVPLTASAIVQITVIDENDNTPVFSTTFYNAEIAYTGSCDNTILTLTATDADSGPNGQVSYYFSQNPYGFFFAVGANSGVVTLQTPVSVNTKYVLEATAKDSGVPSGTTNPAASIRVDTFDPNTVAVIIKLGISKADFLIRKDQFVSQFKSVMSSKYQSCLVRVWCITERSGETAVAAPTRRRLLASSPVNVNLVVVADNSTESLSNLSQGKTFLTSSAVTSVVASDPSGTPSSSLQGSAWDYFVIQNASPYTETVTPWHQTTVGIVFITLACLLTVVLIAITIFAIVWWRKKRRLVLLTQN
ncbi:protocadherin Fat 4-like [Haliotis cracherodii]|uniref:protocadherin Fat 4-like n=1 Tax=Haliotis cracherodii TaxID=6455 RepID=UPI0039E97949